MDINVVFAVLAVAVAGNGAPQPVYGGGYHSNLMLQQQGNSGFHSHGYSDHTEPGQHRHMDDYSQEDRKTPEAVGTIQYGDLDEFNNTAIDLGQNRNENNGDFDNVNQGQQDHYSNFRHRLQDFSAQDSYRDDFDNFGRPHDEDSHGFGNGRRGDFDNFGQRHRHSEHGHMAGGHGHHRGGYSR